MLEVIEFRAWRRWLGDFGRCQAATAGGRQCKNRSHLVGHEVCREEDFHRIEFVMGVTDRCHAHCRPAAPERAGRPGGRPARPRPA